MTTVLPSTRTVRASETAIHVYDPPEPGVGPSTSWGRPPVGPCVAYAHRRLADRRWEVRWVPGRVTFEFPNRLQAESKLAELTGVAL